MNVLIAGIGGRMGREILSIVEKDSSLKAAGGVSRSFSKEGITVVSKFEDLKATGDTVLIDFSLPEVFSSSLAWAVKNGVPFVSGTTGISDQQKQEIKQASQTIAVLWSPNMSLGIAWMKSMIKNFSKLDGFDFQIEELHHRHKKDAPSGTALFLQEELKKQVDANAPEPVAIRGGGIFGEHKLLAMSEEEVITLEHVALNRRVFARGAVTAAKWLQNQPPGLYQLQDLLSL